MLSSTIPPRICFQKSRCITGSNSSSPTDSGKNLALNSSCRGIYSCRSTKQVHNRCMRIFAHRLPIMSFMCVCVCMVSLNLGANIRSCHQRKRVKARGRSEEKRLLFDDLFVHTKLQSEICPSRKVLIRALYVLPQKSITIP